MLWIEREGGEKIYQSGLERSEEFIATKFSLPAEVLRNHTNVLWAAPQKSRARIASLIYISSIPLKIKEYA